MDLSKIPVVPPPPGVTSNFENPYSMASTLLVINVVFSAIALICSALRIYTRAVVIRKVDWDDGATILGLVFSITSVVLSQMMTRHGIGRHVWDVPLSMIRTGMKYFVFATATYCVAIGFIKCTLLLLYWRNFSTAALYFKVMWWATCVLSIGYSVAGVFVSLFGCSPMAYAWDPTIPGGRCIDKSTYYVVHGWLNAVTDLAILVIPLPVVWKLQLTVYQKITLTCLFVLGSCTWVISIYRAISIIQTGEAANDFTFGIGYSAIWSNIEMLCALICACSITYRPLIKRYFVRFSSLSSSRHTEQGPTSNITKQEMNGSIALSVMRKERVREIDAESQEQIISGDGSDREAVR
ncbi:hypothetical protein B0J11DRAFT_599848 [Dendryphion nanum]|uniref:Rhodopsin domain-containing protein n=1 Tax=Dendryphion nanum TaxID=256645 RepID=A0A9P9IUT1_9PLEO|nr:hypothetical protein B0J11DRAFT_599848 [Dendryphion nanum]